MVINFYSITCCRSATQTLEMFVTLMGEIILKGLRFPGFYLQLGFMSILTAHFPNFISHAGPNHPAKEIL